MGTGGSPCAGSLGAPQPAEHCICVAQLARWRHRAVALPCVAALEMTHGTSACWLKALPLTPTSTGKLTKKALAPLIKGALPLVSLEMSRRLVQPKLLSWPHLTAWS